MKYRVRVTQTGYSEYVIEAPSEEALEEHMKQQALLDFEDWDFTDFTQAYATLPAKDSEVADWKLDEFGEFTF